MVILWILKTFARRRLRISLCKTLFSKFFFYRWFFAWDLKFCPPLLSLTCMRICWLVTQRLRSDSVYMISQICNRIKYQKKIRRHSNNYFKSLSKYNTIERKLMSLWKNVEKCKTKIGLQLLLNFSTLFQRISSHNWCDIVCQNGNIFIF